MADSLSEFERTQLSSSVTVANYRILEADQDRKAIADFVRERFTERYVEPVQSMGKKHGFCIMAVSCLLIEAIISFKMG
jgi:hypothetical protein